MMRQATMVLNRQVIRLCKGIIKAWEQWVEDMERELPAQVRKPEFTKLKDGDKYDRTLNS